MNSGLHPRVTLLPLPQSINTLSAELSKEKNALKKPRGTHNKQRKKKKKKKKKKKRKKKKQSLEKKKTNSPKSFT